MQEKLTIIDSKRIGKQNTVSTKKCSESPVRCYTLLRFFSLGIWRIERYVCFWPLWYLQYVYASVCRSHAFGRCCTFPKSLLMTFPRFSCCSLSSKILPVFAENYFLNRCKFLIRALFPLLNGSLHHQCIKNYYLRQYHLLLFTNIRNICNN